MTQHTYTAQEKYLENSKSAKMLTLAFCKFISFCLIFFAGPFVFFSSNFIEIRIFGLIISGLGIFTWIKVQSAIRLAKKEISLSNEEIHTLNFSENSISGSIKILRDGDILLEHVKNSLRSFSISWDTISLVVHPKEPIGYYKIFTKDGKQWDIIAMPFQKNHASIIASLDYFTNLKGINLEKESISKNSNTDIVFISFSTIFVAFSIFSSAYFIPLNFYDPFIYSIPPSIIIFYFTIKSSQFKSLSGHIRESSKYRKGIDKHLLHHFVKFILLGIITWASMGVIIFANGFFADPTTKKEYRAHVTEKYIESSSKGRKLYRVTIKFKTQEQKNIITNLEKITRQKYDEIKLGDTVNIEVNRGYLNILFFGDWKIDSNK